MPTTFICKACGLEQQRNYRLGEREQKYCDNKDCQRVRRREYQRDRNHGQPAYRHKQRDCQARWRKKLSSAQYQRSYRENHPGYVENNRAQQRQRNAKRRCKPLSEPELAPARDPVIVKMNSCSAVKSEAYRVTLNPDEALELIVKMNSCSLDFSRSSCDSIDAIPAVRLIVSVSIDPAAKIRDIAIQQFAEH